MMKILILTAIFLAATGCIEEPPQLLTVSLNPGEGVTDAEIEAVHVGARIWRPCGFEVLPPGDDTGDIEIRVIAAVNLSGPAGWADIQGQILGLNRAFSDYPDYQATVAAHELGHVLLVTEAHLPRMTGLMSSPHHGRVLTTEDHDLACQEADRCCEMLR